MPYEIVLICTSIAVHFAVMCRTWNPAKDLKQFEDAAANTDQDHRAGQTVSEERLLERASHLVLMSSGSDKG